MRWLSVLFLCALTFGQEILRPTADFDGGAFTLGCPPAANKASLAMPYAYDLAGLTTSSDQEAIGAGSGFYKTRIFSPWSSTGNIYSALTLNVSARSSGNLGDNSAASCIKYSIDGGVSYTTLKCEINVGYPKQTFTATLTPTQNLSKLRVAMCVQGSGSLPKQQVGPGDDIVTIFDIWTSGTTPGQDAGNGSTSGQAHRGVVVSN